MTTTDPLSVLRRDFPAKEIGKLPRVTCKDCSQSRTKNCAKHSKAKCKECGGYLTTQHIHLDYVGHAAVTNRLLEADPGWTWEPLAVDDLGVPVVRVENGEATMWVRLTVGGVARIGVGTAPAGSFELHKQLISDAIRNASMRFGVALALWAKEPLPEMTDAAGDPSSPDATDAGGVSAGSPQAGVTPPAPPAPDRVPPAGVEPVAPKQGDEVGSAPAGSTTAPGGEIATGGGRESAATDRGEDPAPSPTTAPSGGTLKDANPSGYNSLNRWCRARAKDWPDDLRAVWWEALAWAVSGGRTTHLGELTPTEASDFRSRVDDHANGRCRWVETDDPRFLGWTLTSEEAA